MKKKALSIALGIIMLLESQSAWATQIAPAAMRETYVNEEHTSEDMTQIPKDIPADSYIDGEEESAVDENPSGIEGENQEETIPEDTEHISGEGDETEIPVTPAVPAPSEQIPSAEEKNKSQEETAQEDKLSERAMPQALELKITPSQTINEGEVVTLTGKVSGEAKGAFYRYIYFDGTNWNEIASMDTLKPVTWRPMTTGNLLVALQVQMHGQSDSNAFCNLQVNPVEQRAKITGFQVKKEDSSMWNATVTLKGEVENPLDQVQSYEYLAYDGQYWKQISISDKLTSAEFIPEKSQHYLLCFQIYDRKGNVIEQRFQGYMPSKPQISVEGIQSSLQSNGDYKLSVETKTNDRYAEYRWMYYDIVKDKWGLIRDWSTKSDTVWHPKYGAYWIQVEGRTSTGIIDSDIIGQMVEKMYVDVSNIQVSVKNVNELHLKADVKTNDKQVKYRWMYYDLSQQVWGLIQDWSGKTEAVWKNMPAGSYWIHLEAQTITGESDQETVGYNVEEPNFKFEGIMTEEKYPGIGLEAKVKSNDKQAEYRWTYYDLQNKVWGLIQDWSSKKTAVWYPSTSGTYWIHVQGKTESGATDEMTIGYVVEGFKIQIDNIKVKATKEKERKLEAVVTTEDPKTEYRWTYYDLENQVWGLIQEWSTQKTAVWKPETFGTYWIHLEVRTSSGNSAEFTIGHVVEKFYVKLGMLQVYTPDYSNYYIHQIVDSNDPNLTYTYMIYDVKNNQWIGLPSGTSTYWQPQKSGDYWVHAIVKGSDGKEYTNTVGCTIAFREFDSHARSVMRNIIFAVETGGQIYGNAKYDTFCPAFNITQNEKAITIGAGGWYATKAQQLLKLIRTEDPDMFEELDTAGIGYDLDNCDWTVYGSDGNGQRTIERGSEKAVCIQKIISSDAGVKVQNQLVDEDMTSYINKAKALGVTDLKAQMFCANIHHLGGYGAMKRVITDCKGDGLTLSMNNLWTSMRNHTSNLDGNGVGANKYKTRHEKVMKWINMYI